MSGYIKLSRKFFKHPFWREERIFSPAEAWLDLISSARFEVEPLQELVKMNIIHINRGELRASQRYLSRRWNWSLGKVNTFIKLLCDERMIERRVEHGETIVIISKYNDYNSRQLGDIEQQEEQENERSLNAGRTHGERSLNKYNKREEGEEGKEVSTPLPQNSKKPVKVKKSQPDALQLPFASPEFILTWEKLSGMPKWKKKLPISLQMALDKLGRYNEAFAIQLMQRAIEGGYQGVVFSDTDQAYSRWLKSRGDGRILTPESDSKTTKLLSKLDGHR